MVRVSSPCGGKTYISLLPKPVSAADPASSYSIGTVALSGSVKMLGRETNHFYLVLRLGMSEAVLHSLHVSSWYVQGQLYVKEKGTKYKTKRHDSIQFRVLRCWL